MAAQRTYLAIDLKSFYASVECVDRHLDPLTTNLVVADCPISRHYRGLSTKKATSRKNGWWSCLLMMYRRQLLDFVSDFFAFQ